MTAKTVANLKNQWGDTDPYDQMIDVYDTIINPQDAVTLAGAVTASSTLGVTGAATLSSTLAVTGASTLTGDTTIVGAFDPQGERRHTYFELFDDFLYQTLTEADTPWILNSGSDDLAIDPAIGAQAGGVVVVTTGDDDGTTAVDAAQLVAHIPVQASSGGLVFETRLHINTAITNVAVNAGLTDATTLEEPFSISGGTYTSNAADAAVFCYDTDATDDEWHLCAVDGGTDDTGCATSGTAPVAATYQTLRIEVSSGGGTCSFFINGLAAGTLSGGGVSPDVNLYATVIACGDSTASKSVDVDYIYVGHTR